MANGDGLAELLPSEAIALDGIQGMCGSVQLQPHLP